MAHKVSRQESNKTMKYVAILLLIQALVLAVNCQASDGDDQFQAYHRDIGRIIDRSTSSQVAAPTQIVLRQPEVPEEVPTEQRAPTTRARGSVTANRKPSRVTLAARTHEAVRTSAISEPAQASILSPATQPASGQQSPFVPLAGPSYQPAQSSLFQPAADRDTEPDVGIQSPNERSSSLANSVSARHSALMAQVAIERHQQHQVESPSSTVDPAGGFTASQSPRSTVALQVQPPPSLQAFQLQQQAASAASPQLTFVDRPEEPQVAPSFEQVLSQGCPSKGVFSWENKDHCDRYYMCTNGTFTEEACPNGLGYSQMGAVYQHCAYNWNVDCGNKKQAQPLASPGCPWQFGIFPVASAVGRCSIDYYVCEWGVPETKRCRPEGLFYDDRIKGCQWADQLGCKSEALLNFKCPPEDEDNPYWPYPRYYHTKQDVIVCVNEQPRLVHCSDEQAVDPSSLACIDLRPKKVAAKKRL